MSYESTHWLCSHHRDDCDGDCRPPNDGGDCERCGGVAMVCPCGPEGPEGDQCRLKQQPRV